MKRVWSQVNAASLQTSALVSSEQKITFTLYCGSMRYLLDPDDEADMSLIGLADDSNWWQSRRLSI
jgi:hypothetical protein